jgi:hypothetical protein
MARTLLTCFLFSLTGVASLHAQELMPAASTAWSTLFRAPFLSTYDDGVRR